MQTEERPQTNHEKTYTQTEAARLCGVTQRVLVNRDGRIGYLSKLHQCFPGRHFSEVAVGSIENQRELQFTSKGVEELRDLIQSISPEPPILNEKRKPTYDSNGKVIKKRQTPMLLNQYAEYVWFKEGIDGAGELKLLQQPAPPTLETIEAAVVEEESGIVQVDNPTELIETAFDQLEQIDSNFWGEVDRRLSAGYQQGIFLKSIELKARAKGESDREQEYYKQAKNVATRRKKS
jgi:hypothetical protein